jgi:hypothetical protein
MLYTLEEASKVARSYELKEGIPQTYLEMLLNENSKKDEDSIQIEKNKIKSTEEILLETVGEKTLVDLRNPLSTTKYIYGILFIPTTSKRLQMANLMPDTWTGDGAHMNSMGNFLNLVFRDSNHHIHNAASLVVFDTECYDSWKALMGFDVAIYGKEFFINGKLRIVADRDKGFDKAFNAVLKPFGVQRFCCSNHLGENIQKKFKKESKYYFLDAVKAKNKSDCDDWFNKLPDKL